MDTIVLVMDSDTSMVALHEVRRLINFLNEISPETLVLVTDEVRETDTVPATVRAITLELRRPNQRLLGVLNKLDFTGAEMLSRPRVYAQMFTEESMKPPNVDNGIRLHNYKRVLGNRRYVLPPPRRGRRGA